MRALLFLLLLSGCSLHHEPGIYPLAVDTARARLRHADTGPLIAARACSVRLDVTVASQGSGALHWAIRGEGRDLAGFTVHVEEAGGEQTRATIDLAAETGPAPLSAPSGQPALRQPLQAAVVEFVDAALNGRAFDPARLADNRPVGAACATTTAGEASMQRPNPWSDDWQPDRFGAPMSSGQATLHASQEGYEERKEDLPKPDNL